jgi:hypothetical protein
MLTTHLHDLARPYVIPGTTRQDHLVTSAIPLSRTKSLVLVPATAMVVPGGQPPAVWAAATALAVGLALVALAATPGLPRILRLVLLAVLVSAAVTVVASTRFASLLR